MKGGPMQNLATQPELGSQPTVPEPGFQPVCNASLGFGQVPLAQPGFPIVQQVHNQVLEPLPVWAACPAQPMQSVGPCDVSVPWAQMQMPSHENFMQPFVQEQAFQHMQHRVFEQPAFQPMPQDMQEHVLEQPAFQPMQEVVEQPGFPIGQQVHNQVLEPLPVWAACPAQPMQSVGPCDVSVPWPQMQMPSHENFMQPFVQEQAFQHMQDQVFEQPAFQPMPQDMQEHVLEQPAFQPMQEVVEQPGFPIGQQVHNQVLEPLPVWAACPAQPMQSVGPCDFSVPWAQMQMPIHEYFMQPFVQEQAFQHMQHHVFEQPAFQPMPQDMQEHVLEQPAFQPMPQDHVLGQPAFQSMPQDHVLGQPAFQPMPQDHVLGQPAFQSMPQDHVLGQPAFQPMPQDHVLGQPAFQPMPQDHVLGQPAFQPVDDHVPGNPHVLHQTHCDAHAEQMQQMPVQRSFAVPDAGPAAANLEGRVMVDDSLVCVEEGGNVQVPESSHSAQNATEASLAVVPATPCQQTKSLSIIRPCSISDLPVKPALVRVLDGTTLAASVHQESKLAEWEWGRAVAAMGLQTAKDGQYLRRNRQHHLQELAEAEISTDQLLYRGDGSHGQGQHGMGSSCFMLMILLVSMTKRFSPQIKSAALGLAIGLLQLAVHHMVAMENFTGMAYGASKRWHHVNLVLDSNGIVSNLEELLNQNPSFVAAWQGLVQKPFCGHRISSALSQPTLWDLIIFLVFAKANPSFKKVWQNVGQFLWPTVLFVIGRILDSLAFLKSQQEVEQLPLLKSRKGKSKLTPWINKLVLLRKMRMVRHHRKIAATSHQDLVPKTAQVVSAEEFLCTSLYALKMKQTYQDCFHYAVMWDPSSYDVETMVSLVFSGQAGPDGCTAYLPIQNMKPVVRSEVDPETQALSAINRLTRIQGYNELRALSHSLQAIGMPLEKFNFPQNLLWQPLESHEKRVKENGQFWVVDSLTGEKRPQIPATFNILSQPLLISMSDQGGINRAGLDYMVHKLHLALNIQFDPYHRGWNDIKLALKQSQGELFKCILSFSLLYNVNYGPFGSKEWFSKKQQKLTDFMSMASPHSEPFLSFIPWICRERSIAEPSTPEDRETLFQSLKSMNSVCALGPIVKLMRWFSFFECEKWYDGECWATKLIMLETKNCSVEKTCGFVKGDEEFSIPAQGLTGKAELRELKMKHGTWGLAPLLVTPSSMWRKDLIKLMVRPCWTAHANRAKNVCTPQANAKYTSEKCAGGWVDEIHEMVLQGFLRTKVLQALYPAMDSSDATKMKRVGIHFDFVTRLASKRCMSLVAQYLRPPMRYCAFSFHGSVENQKQVRKDMQTHWAKLLEMESLHAQGEPIPGLDALHFLHSSLTRVAYLLNERDLLDGTSNATAVIHALCVHLGDTACIENTHQSAKDTLRQSRHKQRGRVHKMKACLDAKVLQTRRCNHVEVSEVEIAMASMKDLPPFVPLTHPNKHAMSREFQNMMQTKSGSHYWPSTSAATQFEEAMAFEYLMKTDAILDCIQLSFLAGDPGTVLIHQPASLVVLVLGKSSSGFTGWILDTFSEALEDAADAEDICFVPCPSKASLVLQHITSKDDWLEVPCSPLLRNQNGALILKQTGPPIPVLKARVLQGLDLTVRDCKTALRACGIQLPGTPSKNEVYEALIKTQVEGESDLQECLKKSAAKIKASADDDAGNTSDMEGLLELLEEDLNRNDPDVREEKKNWAKKGFNIQRYHLAT